jgi:hypothetical protein
MSMTSDLIFKDEESTSSAGSSKSLANGKRGLQARPSNIPSSNDGPASKKRKSGIPPPKVTVTPTRAKAKAAGKSAAKSSKVTRSLSLSSSSSLASSSSSSFSSSGNEMAGLTSQHKALLTTLKESVINTKPVLKGVSKTNYRERMNKFEDSYRTLRKSAGEYQKHAFQFIEQITNLERNLASEYRSSVAEVESLRTSCESFESEMSESHKQLTILRTESASLEKKGKQLEQTVETLNQRVKTLENESVQYASQNATLEAKVSNYETRVKEQSIKMEEQELSHNKAMEKNTNDLNERYELKMSGLNEKLTHVTSTLNNVRQELIAATTKATTLESQLNTMKVELSTLKEQAIAHQMELQQKALIEVKQTSEIQHLKASLDSKNKEMDRALDGLKHTQSMSERRVDELSNEKNEMKTKLDTMETERRELESTNSNYKSELDVISRSLADEKAITSKLENDNQELRNDLISLKTKKETVEELNTNITNELSNTKVLLNNEIKEHNLLKFSNQELIVNTTNNINELKNNLLVQTNKANKFETEAIQYLNDKNDLLTQLKVVQNSAGASAQDQLENMMRLTVENENLKKRLGVDQGIDLLSEAQEKVRILEQKYYKSDALRKKLHNKVQELRGNVRVAVRVRPLLGNEAESETNSQKCSSSSSSSSSGSGSVITGGAIVVDSLSGENESMELSIIRGAGQGKKMSFDKVFGQKCNQKAIFNEVSELIQSALDGYNVCIFAYGQTGSGKTFTMQGGNSDDTRGIIPRSISQILETSNSMKNDGWSFNIKASFVEIYNEEIIDLLSSKNKTKQEVKGSMSFGDNSKSTTEKSKIIIRQLNTGTSIEGLEEIELKEFSQLDTIMGKAEKNRR